MTTLILAPTLELAQQLADGSDAVLVSLTDEFVRRSDGSYGVRGDVYEDYLRVAQELARNGTCVKRIIHAGAFGSRFPHEIPSFKVGSGFVQGFLSAAHTLRAFRAQSDQVTQFLVLSSGVHSVVENDVVAYERTPVSGLVRSASIEWPDLTFVHLDTELSSSATEAARHARRELDACPQQEDVAYRSGQRYVPNLEIASFAGEVTTHDETGLAVVAGGLGGVGRHLVGQVARAGYQHILVLGRSEATPAELANLDAKVTASVHFARADVTDLDALERAISDAEEKYGNLRLLVDATGSYTAGDLNNGFSVSEREMIRNKLLGGLAVGQVVSCRKQARLVRSSSAVTFFGGAGIAAYAAANYFIEGLTRAEVEEGKTSECIAWSIWVDTGISQGSVVRAFMQRQGYVEMQPGTAETFNAAFGIPGGCVYARLDPSASMVSAQFPVLARGAQTLVIECEKQNNPKLDNLQDELGNKIPIRWSNPAGATDSVSSDAVSRGPFGPVEKKLHRIWQQTLRQTDIGIDHNFFELGGSSLEGATLIALINKEMGYRFCFTDLIEFPTIRAQANAIAPTQPYAGTGSSKYSFTGKVIRLNKPGRKPLFCVHSLFGLVYPYVPLANLLPERTFFAFQASGFDGGEVICSIEAMARCYIQEMKTIQPDGPYDLCGWSLGALVALEMAQQLVRTGDKVAHLVIIDQATDSIERFLEWQPIRIQAQRLGSILMAAGASFDPVLRGRTKDLLALRHPFVTLRFVREWMGPMLRVALVNRQAGINYKLQRYPGTIDLLYTGDPEFTAIRDERLGWDRIANGGVRVQRLLGSHLTLHELPYVQSLADGIRSILE
ncbi:SDR family NAD(P)-dependent oxidoreductase [uncultured Propionibacterium sp.]|uniref:SDR family NAD(P)-dependent oxidoreductase n=1 Tax=uncultured Propionibacterium sp. TaxID=218066 RepID=UPI002931078F|nr:SDR family NAD(P)-dependent oxidoreductase [uncultured Propionibacterium sp.]